MIQVADFTGLMQVYHAVYQASWLYQIATRLQKSRRQLHIISSCGQNIVSPVFSSDSKSGHAIIHRLGCLFEQGNLCYRPHECPSARFVFDSANNSRFPCYWTNHATKWPNPTRSKTQSGSTTSTRSPFCTFRVSVVHFRLCKSFNTYSLSHRFQTWFVTTWACRHRRLLDISLSTNTTCGKLGLGQSRSEGFFVREMSTYVCKSAAVQQGFDFGHNFAFQRLL